MNSTIRAVRALTAWQFRRIFRVLIGAIVGVLMVLWLAMILAAWYWTAWWLIFMILLLPVSLVVLALGIGGWWLSGKVLPRHLSRDEKQHIDHFNDKLFGLVEEARTPVPILGILFAFDVMRGRGNSRIQAAVENSASLKGDFEQIRRMFADE